MADDSPADEEELDVETEASIEASETESTSEAVLDVEAVEQRQRSLEDLQETVAEQNERIEDLEGLLLDLSTRVADGDGTGVCPDCHGPVVKRNPWFRSARIECASCERVFHEY
ncbi:hypothetical protein [Natronomonas marina]|jgi:myo-inositol catabolism protein IolC|uniref:hypothetical protein n=1 Tax=Natronomonas marina TaxID=2961939 RepID=UPI0020C963DE|nr:hypothetical protein [Natronomonas marina]